MNHLQVSACFAIITAGDLAEFEQFAGPYFIGT